jgi:uncharacterized membrane-anchored protein
MQPATEASEGRFSKVPQVTLLFWIIKIFCTTLGETGGDAVTMSWLKADDPGLDSHSKFLAYLIGTAIFAAIFIAAVAVQIIARKFHPFLYWVTIIATTTVGTTMADFADRSLGVGYTGGSLMLLVLLLASLGVWYKSEGSINVNTVSTPRVEMFYWVTIMFSQTLGTALGDWTADSMDLGYGWAALIFGSLLAMVAACHFWTKISKTAIFWAAFILTRPLGAVVGDFLDKPLAEGGLNLSRYLASGVLVALVIAGILIFPQRAGKHPEN